MGLLSTLKRGMEVLGDHPVLIGWYLRNRLRVATLGYERKNMDGVSRYPRSITFKPVLSCNLRCKMCSFVVSGDVFISPRKSLPLEVWTAVVDDVAPFRPYITLTGGEPTMYPYISELILHIKERGLQCTVTTNGTLLTQRAEVFMRNPPDIMVVSLDGPAEVHNEVRAQPKSFERAVEGIRAVQELKKELKKKNPLLVINCAITSYNYRHLEAMVDIAHQLGASALNYQHLWSLTRKMVDEHNEAYGHVHHVSYEEMGGMEPPPTDPNEVVGVVRRIRQRTQDVNGRMFVTFHPNLTDEEVYRWYADPHNWVRRRPTACAWMNTDILPNGDVSPCFNVIVGNITQDRFTNIWNNYAFREHRKRLAAGGDFPICVRCCAYFRRD